MVIRLGHFKKRWKDGKAYYVSSIGSKSRNLPKEGQNQIRMWVHDIGRFIACVNFGCFACSLRVYFACILLCVCFDC